MGTGHPERAVRDRCEEGRICAATERDDDTAQPLQFQFERSELAVESHRPNATEGSDREQPGAPTPTGRTTSTTSVESVRPERPCVD